MRHANERRGNWEANFKDQRREEVERREATHRQVVVEKKMTKRIEGTVEVACRKKGTQRKKGVTKREGALRRKVFLCNDQIPPRLSAKNALQRSKDDSNYY